MGGLAPIHWNEFERFLVFVGCRLVREKDDHRVWQRAGLKRPVIIPKEAGIPIFIIRNNLRVLGVKVEEYLEIKGKL